VPAPVQIFLAWCLLLPAFCGVGFAAARLLPGPAERIGWPLAFWTGLAVASALLAGWHLFAAVDGRVWVLLAPLAALGLALERPRPRMGLLALAVFAFWLATRAAQPGVSFDDGLYYTQTVRWFSLYPAVPGLGNLHPFLALNNAFHLLVAALGVGPFHLRGQHLLNGLLLLAAIAPCAAGLWRVLDPRARPAPADWFAALLFGPLLDFSLAAGLSAPAADFAVAIAGTALLVLALGPALRGEPSGTRRTAAVLASCAGAMIVKLSLLCIAVPAALFAAAHWTLSIRPARRERLRMAGFAALAGAAIFGPWMAHSAVLSGYPLYPLPAFALPVDWRMDPAVVASIYHWVHAFARWAGHSDAEVTANSAWIVRWFGREWLNDRTFLIPALLTAAGALALLIALAAGRRPPRPIVAGALAATAGLAIWWVLAPDLRFAGPLPWAEGGLLVLAAASAYRPSLAGATRVFLAAGILAIAAGAFLPCPPLFVWKSAFPPLHHDDPARDAALPGGERVHLSRNNACWDPPCASVPLDPRLRLRKPGDLAAGFTVQPAAR
jgi:hypothetical protein